MMRKLPQFLDRLFKCLLAFLLDLEVCWGGVEGGRGGGEEVGGNMLICYVLFRGGRPPLGLGARRLPPTCCASICCALHLLRAQLAAISIGTLRLAFAHPIT